MTKQAIEVRDLGKKFIINHKNKASYATLKDDVGNLGKRLIGKSIDTTEEEFWALKDVNFDVAKGEIFGVIGKNGSGKSTLLKTLSRIISPTTGTITLRGKVASLLEVGTGFHPELTGRENIYFNGSMLGMRRSEITQKFQEIVDFSEVEKFIDTPVKFYSSGMYVRLAFSVAAHLEPEILILDEVLAVGDASFQKKSLRKILDTMQNGKTVLFVSHSMASVRQLCTEGIMLESGHVVAQGKIDSIIEAYSLENENIAAMQLGAELKQYWKNDGELDAKELHIEEVYITDQNDKRTTEKTVLSNGRDYFLNIVADVKTSDEGFGIGYTVWDDAGKNLIYMSFSTDQDKVGWPKAKKGRVLYRARMPKNTLNEGSYRLKVIASVYGKKWILEPDSSPVKLVFRVKHADQVSPFWKENRGGIITPLINWTIQ